MRHLSIRQTQLLGVVALAVVIVVGLSAVHLAGLARLSLAQSLARCEMLAAALFDAASRVRTTQASAFEDLRADPGVRAVLTTAIYGRDVTFAAITDADGVARAHSDPALEHRQPEPGRDLEAVLARRGAGPLFDIFVRRRTLVYARPLLLDGTRIGEVRIGLSPLLAGRDVRAALQPALVTAGLALLAAVLVALALARVVLRPIHVIRSGLARLGRGELDGALDLAEPEVRDLRGVFEAVGAQLRALAAGGQAGAAARLSSRIVALGRLTAGVAHEVKNPLHAMTIHLALLRRKLGDGADAAAALTHVDTIGREVARLDAVVKDFLAFTRPAAVTLGPVRAGVLLADVAQAIGPQADATGVRVTVDVVDGDAVIEADAALFREALVNLAVNAVQAMPDGGTLQLETAREPDGRAVIRVRDTGCGIPPEHLGRIFDLHFTTRDEGSGVGLSMVFRTVQLHDGDIDVESAPGAGTTVTLRLPAVR